MGGPDEVVLELCSSRTVPDRPVQKLAKRIKWILKEFLIAQDGPEAERAFRDLSAPHFHHEVRLSSPSQHN